ncbi:O-antigen ligase family protein [Halomonas sp. BM-2019]|uniref:O-antigen ligase family protein n=1 Tax=Halomonas sp. BM-2019 TaxID=2811227 RepID=UPI001B3C25C2|nr:MAG: O-antigen ligase family protein [Halomonas sp. BM-2019]
MNVWTGLATWASGALSLSVQGGYLVFIAMAALALPLCSCWTNRLWDYAVPIVPAVILAMFAVVWLVMADRHGDIASVFRLVWPAMMLAPALLVLLLFPPSLAWLWSGLSMGGIYCGVSSLVQRIVLDHARVSGPEPLHPILFGNFSLLLAFFCLAGLGWAWHQPYRIRWMMVLLAGAAGGGLASMLSGTRGGWVMVPFLLAVVWATYGRGFSRGFSGGLLAGILALASLAVWLPQTGVKERIDIGLDHASRYLHGERGITSGARLEIWRGAALLIAERPLQGWGNREYRRGLERLGSEGRVDPDVARYWHAHSDLLDAWVRRGVVGFLALLILYAMPIVLFWKGLGHRCPARRALAACGMLLGVGLFGFGLTYSYMVYPVGVALYTSWLCIFWGFYRSPSLAE